MGKSDFKLGDPLFVSQSWLLCKIDKIKTVSGSLKKGKLQVEDGSNEVMKLLNNRILVIGMDRRYLEFISQMKSDFLFISLEHPSRYRSGIHSLEGLIFESSMLLEMGTILQEYRAKPIWGIGKGPILDSVTWLQTPPSADKLEQLLLDVLGELRRPPVETGHIETGTVVKNKTFSSWGIGVVKKNMGDDLYLVHFPNAIKIAKKDEHICHKSTLRIICSVKELSNETDK